MPHGSLPLFLASPARPIDLCSRGYSRFKPPNPSRNLNYLQTTPVYLTIDIHPVFVARQRCALAGYLAAAFAIF